MEKVMGFGGIFFKAKDPEMLRAWYAENLGIDVQPWGGAIFPWEHNDPYGDAYSVWMPFEETSDYFEPSTRPFMVNFRVADLDAMMAQLITNGCLVEERMANSSQGRFGWVIDPEGNRIELWEPPQ